MRRGACALVLASVVLAAAPDVLAQPDDVRVEPSPAPRAPRPVTAAEQRGRIFIVTGGIVVSIGIALSWTGIAGLVYQVTQHRSVPWAAPVSIASIPVEVVGSGLVVWGAVDLLGQRRPDVTSNETPSLAVAAVRPVLSFPLLRAEF